MKNSYLLVFGLTACGGGSGFDIGTAPLTGTVSGTSWSLVVADLRETFGARGKESTHGETREWSNGNLHAFIEPTRTGYRMRLGTLKGDAIALNRMGVMGVAMGAFVGIARRT